jgi:hypothetical protein
MADISVFGARAQVVASNTFPSGFSLSQFADDADPFDVPSIKIKDVASGANGDLVTWSKAVPITVTVNMVPNSDDDKNLAVLLEANRAGKGKLSARDEITMTVVYPDLRTVMFSGGVITDGPPALSASSGGRLKTRAYSFAFENVVQS